MPVLADVWRGPVEQSAHRTATALLHAAGDDAREECVRGIVSKVMESTQDVNVMVGHGRAAYGGKQQTEAALPCTASRACCVACHACGARARVVQ